MVGTVGPPADCGNRRQEAVPSGQVASTDAEDQYTRERSVLGSNLVGCLAEPTGFLSTHDRTLNVSLAEL